MVLFLTHHVRKFENNHTFAVRAEAIAVRKSDNMAVYVKSGGGEEIDLFLFLFFILCKIILN